MNEALSYSTKTPPLETNPERTFQTFLGMSSMDSFGGADHPSCCLSRLQTSPVRAEQCGSTKPGGPHHPQTAEM